MANREYVPFHATMDAAPRLAAARVDAALDAGASPGADQNLAFKPRPARQPLPGLDGPD